MGTRRFHDLQVYQLAEQLSDEIWKLVLTWEHLAKDTIGKQLIKAADSIGANIAEGSGRGTYPDNRRFVRIARGSLYEVRHWLRRAYVRGLMNEDQVRNTQLLLEELNPKLNSYLKSIGIKKTSNSHTTV
jgi:four helix bundle protein